MLNAYFVPVHVDGTFLTANAESAPEQLASYRELFQEMRRANLERQKSEELNLSIGTVHAYVLGPDGRAIDSRHVAEAGPASVIQMLESAIEKLGLKPAEPLTPPSVQSPRPEAPDDALVLHLTARYLVARNQAEARRDVEGEFVPHDSGLLGSERSGDWSALPSEDWLVLNRGEWTALLPPAAAGIGDSWQVEAELTEKLLTRFYPTTEQNDLSKNRLDEKTLKLTLLRVDKGRATARIDGQLRMKHPFYPGRDDDKFVAAKVVGFLGFDPTTPRIHSLEMITENATYGETGGRLIPFGVAIRNDP